MELQTKQLILREYTHADFDALYDTIKSLMTATAFAFGLSGTLKAIKISGSVCGRFCSKYKTTKTILLSAIAE